MFFVTCCRYWNYWRTIVELYWYIAFDMNKHCFSNQFTLVLTQSFSNFFSTHEWVISWAYKQRPYVQKCIWGVRYKEKYCKKKEMLMKYIKNSPSVICIMPLDDKSECQIASESVASESGSGLRLKNPTGGPAFIICEKMHYTWWKWKWEVSMTKGRDPKKKSVLLDLYQWGWGGQICSFY